jgi:hypothetical protein
MSITRSKVLLPGLVLVFGVLSPALFSQETSVFRKAPPEVDAALRPRVEEFYNLNMAAKFREAEKLVCEDSKDAYYGMNKLRPESFEISGITYSDNFTRAYVLVTAKVRHPMFGRDQVLLAPVSSMWALQKSQWCFQVPHPKSGTLPTPFGPMLAPKNPQGVQGAPAPGQPTVPDQKVASPEKIYEGVTVSPRTLRFEYGVGGEQTVQFHNGLPGYVSLSISKPALPELEVVADKTDVPPRKSVALHVRYSPGAEKLSGVIRVTVRVEPLGEVFDLDIDFGKKPATQ